MVHWLGCYHSYLQVVIEISKLNDDVARCDWEGEVNLESKGEEVQDDRTHLNA